MGTIFIGPDALERFVAREYTKAYQRSPAECDVLADDKTTLTELRFATPEPTELPPPLPPEPRHVHR